MQALGRNCALYDERHLSDPRGAQDLRYVANRLLEDVGRAHVHLRKYSPSVLRNATLHTLRA